ncbi:MAG: hypothetical protein AAF922_06775 [Pseudomonadota bacterium]
MTKRVLLIGWHPDAVNFKKWPGLTPEKLMTALERDSATLREAGFDVSFCLLTSAENAVSEAETALGSEYFDVVMIGAGVRRDEDHALTF